MNTPLIPLWLIWFSGVCSELRNFMIYAGGIFFVILFIILVIWFVVYESGECETFKITKKMYFVLILSGSMWVGGWFIPTQSTVYTMMVGSQVTAKNVQIVGGGIKNTVDYMFNKTQEMVIAINNSKGKDTKDAEEVDTKTSQKSNDSDKIEKLLLQYLEAKYKQ